jgi:phage shock protein PspC (stress-responsive transcriptional regulator)
LDHDNQSVRLLLVVSTATTTGVIIATYRPVEQTDG